MKDLSVEKQIYLCKYHDVDTSLCNTMGMKSEEIEATLEKLKANGLYDQYRKMDEFEYDRVIKVEKNKTRAEKILDKYRFDKSRSTYERMRQVLSECESIRDATKLNMTTVFRKIAQKEGVETYVINNDCKRAIERLNRFKTIKVLYGNTYSMHLEQLEQLQNDIDTVLNLLEKKDKIIDRMAEQLAGLTIFDIDKEEPLILKDKEEVKQYFENKAEEEK